LSRSESLVTTITEKPMTYGLGRAIEATDMPAVRKVVRNAAEGDYRFSDIVLGIVQSDPFLRRTATGGTATIAQVQETRP